MRPILVRDRLTNQLFEEKVFGRRGLAFLYGHVGWKDKISRCFREALSRFSHFSRLGGWWYKRPQSRKLIAPFIQLYDVDPSEFLQPVESFTSFNDFFIRRLKPESRPIHREASFVIPADGRYLFYPNLQQTDGFVVKGQWLYLDELLGDRELAKKYEGGAMVIARLCPTDYHRFHFPCDCFAGPSRLINGPLYSVNPWALQKNLKYLSENKRFITSLTTADAGTVQFIEIGATTVGSVVQTYVSNMLQHKGTEKGYFEFGGSCLILLFEPGKIDFEEDLLQGPLHQEVRCLLGQPMARLLS